MTVNPYVSCCLRRAGDQLAEREQEGFPATAQDFANFESQLSEDDRSPTLKAILRDSVLCKAAAVVVDADEEGSRNDDWDELDSAQELPLSAKRCAGSATKVVPHIHAFGALAECMYSSVTSCGKTGNAPFFQHATRGTCMRAQIPDSSEECRSIGMPTSD